MPHFPTRSFPPLLTLFFMAAAASAQSTLSLVPSAFHTTPEAPISLRLLESTPSSNTHPTDLHWFFIRCAGTQENRSAEDAPKADADGAMPITLPTPGAAMIGVDLAPRISEWSIENLTAFAALALHPGPCPTSPATVEHLLSATTLVRINTPQPNSPPSADPTPTSKSGQQVEIRPLIDPTTILQGSDLPFRIYILGDAVPRGTVTAFHPASQTKRTITTDAKAIGNLRIDHTGTWRIEFHTFAPIAEGPAAFRAGSVSLTFSVPEQPTPEEAAK